MTICGEGLAATLVRRDFVAGAAGVAWAQLAVEGNADRSTLLPFLLSAVSLLVCRAMGCDIAEGCVTGGGLVGIEIVPIGFETTLPAICSF
jgi:hypothetical protein